MEIQVRNVAKIAANQVRIRNVVRTHFLLFSEPDWWTEEHISKRQERIVCMPRIKGIFLLRSEAYNEVYGPEARAVIDELIDIIAPPQTASEVLAHPEVLRDVEIILSGWGAPLMDEAFLALAPCLRAVFYGAGSIRGFVTDALWERGIIVTSAQATNAIPVAEYTLATILFSLKHGWRLAEQTRQAKGFPERNHIPGVYGASVGIISLGIIGRMVREFLRPFQVRVLAYDPYVSQEEAARLHISLCSLEQLFQEARVVTLHAPLLPETVGMVCGSHLASMSEGSTFINTARGALVRQEELIAVLEQRADLHAVLDVTEPEPPDAGSALYTLANITLTPHIAGSVGSERRHLGQTMLAELRRFVAGEPLQHAITREQSLLMAMP
jgi:phosphoglycerate dehydrogenase-like enzyme